MIEQKRHRPSETEWTIRLWIFAHDVSINSQREYGEDAFVETWGIDGLLRPVRLIDNSAEKGALIDRLGRILSQMLPAE